MFLNVYAVKTAVGNTLSVPLERFFWGGNLPRKNCDKPSTSKMKVLYRGLQLVMWF